MKIDLTLIPVGAKCLPEPPLPPLTQGHAILYKYADENTQILIERCAAISFGKFLCLRRIAETGGAY